MIKEYLNVDEKSESLADSLFDLWVPEGNTNIPDSLELLKGLALHSYERLGNIRYPDEYLRHCETVSRNAESISHKITDNYPAIRMKPEHLEYLGLIEDFMRCLANEDGQHIHEILGHVYLGKRGKSDIAEYSQPHFVAREILTELHKDGKFQDVSFCKENLYLDILTVTDALCTTEFLGDDNFEKGLKRRIHDIRKRYPKDAPIISGLDNGGEDRLKELTRKVSNLYSGSFDTREVMGLYDNPKGLY